MKTARALALSIALVSPAPPIAAQDRLVTTPGLPRATRWPPESRGPIARAATREAARLATAPQVDRPSDSHWARVTKLAPGTAVTLTVRELPPRKRYVVRADEDNLTVLDLTNPAISPVAQSVLLDVASHHPEDVAAAQTGNTFVLDKNVRMGPDGVFVADRKVADLGQVIETIMQSDVREIRRSGRTGGSVVGAVAGATGGLLLGRLVAANLVYKQCGGSCDDETLLIGLSLIGLPITGGLLGYHAAGRQTEDVIYRAP